MTPDVLKELMRAYDRKYYALHKDQINAIRRENYARNREKMRAKAKKRRDANKDHINARNRARYARICQEVRGKQEWLGDARRALGLTQRYVAWKCGCCEKQISKLETGTADLSKFAARDTLCLLLKGVSYDELLKSTREVDGGGAGSDAPRG